MTLKSFVRRVRAFVVALLIPALMLIPNQAQAFDIWQVLDTIATTPGVSYPSSLPLPSEIKSVIGVVQSCLDQPASDTGIITCLNKAMENPTLAQHMPVEKIEMAINIYLDVKNGDYIQLAIDAGRPLACLAAPLIVGFDVCGAIDALIAVGGAVVSVVAAFIEGLTTVAEWVSELLGGGAPSGGSTYNEPKVLLDYFLTQKDAAFGARLSADVGPWNAFVAKLRAQAKSTIGQNGTPIPGLLAIPNDSAIDQAITAFMAAIGDRWDKWYYPGEGGVVGLTELRNSRSAYVKANVKNWAVAQYKAADTAGRTAATKSATTQCESADTAGKALENWQFERGKLDPSRVPNNEANRKKFCEVILAVEQSMNEGWVQRKTALASGCVLQPAANDFDAMKCSTYKGLEACMKSVTGITSHAEAKAIKVDASQLCQAQIVAPGAAFETVLRKHDPKGRCKIANATEIACARDLSVPKACTKALADYKTDSAGNTTVGTSAPLISAACALKRDAEYNGLIERTATLRNELIKKLADMSRGATEAYNRAQSEPSRKIGTNPFDYNGLIRASLDDPLILDVQGIGEKAGPLRDAVTQFPGLSTVDSSDPDNDGQNQPGYRFVPAQLTPEQKKQLEQIAEAVEMHVKGLLTSSAPPAVQARAGDAVINPGDYIGRSDPLAQLMTRGGIALRFTQTEVNALRNVQATKGANGQVSYKAMNAEQAAALTKAVGLGKEMGGIAIIIGK